MYNYVCMYKYLIRMYVYIHSAYVRRLIHMYMYVRISM